MQINTLKIIAIKNFIFILVFFISGCISLKEHLIRKQINILNNKINPKDGISKKEAIIIAQKCLFESKYSNDYYISKYCVSIDNNENHPLNKTKTVWGVSFEAKNKSDDNCQYGAIISKETGEKYCDCIYGL